MCEPVTIAMTVMAVAMAVKQSMDQKKAAKAQRQHAIAQQKLKREAYLKQRAEAGDQAAMKAFEDARSARIDEARVRTMYGEKGGTGNEQVDLMLSGLGFGQGLQQAADQRSHENKQAGLDLQLRADGINFANRMRTIDAKDPSGLDIGLGAAMAGANAYAGAGGLKMTGGSRAGSKATTGAMNRGPSGQI